MSFTLHKTHCFSGQAFPHFINHFVVEAVFLIFSISRIAGEVALDPPPLTHVSLAILTPIRSVNAYIEGPFVRTVVQIAFEVITTPMHVPVRAIEVPPLLIPIREMYVVVFHAVLGRERAILNLANRDFLVLDVV
jgi:hypothetical protein